MLAKWKICNKLKYDYNYALNILSFVVRNKGTFCAMILLSDTMSIYILYNGTESHLYPRL